MDNSFEFGEKTNDEQWAPMSDLMAALMLIFMFVAIVFVRSVIEEATVQQEECEKIFQVLSAEFGSDFENWDVELLSDLTIRFRNPDILFESGEDTISIRFQTILEEFFPRYLNILRSDPYRDDIREVRIEGHTSSVWLNSGSDTDAYFKNMALSQARTLAILNLVLELPASRHYSEWLRPLITANGLSSSKPILNQDGSEDVARSRRVEFRLMTSSCQMAGVYDNPR